MFWNFTTSVIEPAGKWKYEHMSNSFLQDNANYLHRFKGIVKTCMYVYHCSTFG